MLLLLIISNASTASASASMVLGDLLMMSFALVLSRVTPFSSILLKSPSVITPERVPSSFNTAVRPSRFLVISRITSLSPLSSFTTGRSFCLLKSITCRYNFFPKAPPGWYFAKSFELKFLISISETANASPMAIWAVVLEVGARLLGQASLLTVVFRTWWASFAKSDDKFPTMAMRGLPIFFKRVRSSFISGLSPLFEMIKITSSS